MYVRQLAWLRATPKESTKTRWQLYKDAGEDVSLPDVAASIYLVNLLEQAGTATPTGMGLVPLTWAEISQWLSLSRLNLSTWEIETIRHLSCTYVSEQSHASDPDRQPPYSKNPLVVDEAELSQRVAAALRSLKK